MTNNRFGNVLHAFDRGGTAVNVNDILKIYKKVLKHWFLPINKWIEAKKALAEFYLKTMLNIGNFD